MSKASRLEGSEVQKSRRNVTNPPQSTPRTDSGTYFALGVDDTELRPVVSVYLARDLERERAALLTFAESVVYLFGVAYPKAGLKLDMDKDSLLNAAKEAIKKAED